MGNLCGLEIQLRVGHCDLSFGQDAVGVVETLLLRQHPARGRACSPSGGPLCRYKVGMHDDQCSHFSDADVEDLLVFWQCMDPLHGLRQLSGSSCGQ